MSADRWEFIGKRLQRNRASEYLDVLRDLGFRLKFKVGLVRGKLVFNRIIKLNLVPKLAKHETVIEHLKKTSVFDEKNHFDNNYSNCNSKL